MRLAGAGDPGGSSVVVETMRWGLVPSYQARDPTPADHFVAFNARAETLAERPTFGRLLRRNRGVALIDGFYEWRAEGGRGRDAVKQPYYLSLRRDVGRGDDNTNDDPAGAPSPNPRGTPDDVTSPSTPMRCAAVWDRRRGALPTCAIVTVPASRRVEWLHDRMPAVLRTDEEVRRWVGAGEVGCSRGGECDDDDEGEEDRDRAGAASPASPSEPSPAAPRSSNGGREHRRTPEPSLSLSLSLLRPLDDEALRWHPVTTAMSRPTFEGPECSRPCAREVEKHAGDLAGLFERKRREDGKGEGGGGGGCDARATPPDAGARANGGPEPASASPRGVTGARKRPRSGAGEGGRRTSLVKGQGRQTSLAGFFEKRPKGAS